MSIPRYLQLHALLKEQIITGKFSEGSLLPSENQLSLQHQITRSMVRQALKELEKDGLIRKQQGKGSIVEKKENRLALLSFRGFSEVVGASDHQASSHFLRSPYKSRWGKSFFFELSHSEKKRGCVVLERLRKVDGQPVMLEYTYLPDVLPDFLDKGWVEDSLFKTLMTHYQLSIVSVEQYISAIKASVEMAAHLKTQAENPLLKINRKYATDRPGFYVYSSLYCNTEHYAISSFIE
ncbi:DNA-binding GntR family transcriptional regulator [Catalinimonas alkaloidigena]|uniref:GntR family transcriptional regulator n=1 Tax=Catalinimonas alkaloidigena TaxID=1075417 RepID=UPI0024056553|nr:GntR family transcriptional regulator [Catalinimonas alkaloidigena]MDF9800602.1 DNA-binding GntR family transcriptional regulator [Catalinimonas alkaloidigena]